MARPALARRWELDAACWLARDEVGGSSRGIEQERGLRGDDIEIAGAGEGCEIITPGVEVGGLEGGVGGGIELCRLV